MYKYLHLSLLCGLLGFTAPMMACGGDSKSEKSDKDDDDKKGGDDKKDD